MLGGTLYRGGSLARGGNAVAASAEDERVRQRAASGGSAETRGGIGFCKFQKLH